MSYNRQFLFFLLNFFITYQGTRMCYVLGNYAQSKSGSPFKKCCDLGTSWAKEGLRCEKFAGPVADVPRAQQALCLEAVDICCNRGNHEISCDKGKKSAREGKACVDGSSGKSRAARALGDYQRDCCEGCKLVTSKPTDDDNSTDPTSKTKSTAISSSTTSSDTTSKTKSTAISSSTSSSSTIDIDFDVMFPDDSTDLTDSSSLTTTSDDGIPTPPLDDICQILKNLLCSHICVPTPGSYYCECPKGYVLLEDQKTCRTDGPINRCESDNPCEHQCTDTGTAVKCECDPGFELAKDGHSCQLKPTEVITSTPKSRDKPKDKKKPRCPPGYRFNASARVCDDVDECLENPCRAREKCENVVGSYICISKKRRFKSKFKGQEAQLDFKESCPPGYVWDKQFQVCSDIDECADQVNVLPCPIDTHFCVNTEGSYACHELTESKGCPAGFKLNITRKTCQDVDECLESLHGCLPEVEECRNTEGAYECDILCRKGYTFSRGLGICVDINECEELNPCPREKSICINLPGTYQCGGRFAEEFEEEKNLEDNEVADDQYETDTIDESYLINDKNKSSNISVSSALIACEPGYQWIDNNCYDVNECTDGPGCQEHERCVNRLGGYDCLPLCNTGWYFDRTSKQCRDVDECLLGRHNCSQDSQVCRNTNGSYVCDEIPPCDSGFRRAFNGTCVDIDECIDKLHNCPLHLHQYCVNRVGTFECVTRLPDCTDGYRFSMTSKRCEDIDECSTKSPCDAKQERCVNLPGSYRCDRPNLPIPKRRPACPAGFRYDSKSRQCEALNALCLASLNHIDECAGQVNLCGSEVCYNQPGGYTCVRAPIPITEPTTQDDSEIQSTVKPDDTKTCSEGFKNVRNRGCLDVNECDEVEEACSSNEECVNTIGSYTCNCRIGFRRDNLTQACVDINECQLLENDCLPTQRCDNTLGSYNCVRFLPCGTGYTLNAATEICEDDDECLLGTHDCGSSGQCIDIDECYGPSNPCARSPLQRCINTVGSYRCVSRVICGAGWTLDPVTSRCVDLDECATGTHECGPDQTCENRQGGYLCSCPAGHALGPNRECIDIDECSMLSGNVCGSGGRCENTVGSYRCVCDAGYEKSSKGTACQDTNECEKSPGICQQNCVNTWGSYRCSCKPGYRLHSDNRSCTDVDECTEFKENNLCVGICDNTPGIDAYVRCAIAQAEILLVSDHPLIILLTLSPSLACFRYHQLVS
ncbi:Similar to FBN3: Fibrillin-3 (Homo sapiens) [Cotesia congregata]|uniref:Similar to FBN3: Fibrillin-3 (Homo sapiens) n=1 Tax=Cotesia congregata TaxID=51543 RepID=A0A8J2MIS2_COTCN|nr:Similar to FBN3: Fibrillin-3 (Homo sapiens) [Cotesia congregata]